MEVKFEMPDSLKGHADADALAKVGQAIVDAIAKTGDGISQADLDKRLKEFSDAGATKTELGELEKAVKTQGSAITALKERGVMTGGATLRGQLKSAMSGEAFREAMKNRRTFEIEIKADPATITAANFENAQPYALRHEIEPGIGVAPKEQNVIYQLLSKGSTNSRDIYWVNRGPVNGSADFIGEGEVKPPVDWVYTSETSNAKKVAVSTKVSTEMLEDFDFMESEIRDILRELVEDHVDAELLNGSGTGNDLTGILTGASGYVGTELDGTIPAANTADAIRAGILQMRVLHQRPDIALMSPASKAALDLLKNENGNYISADALAAIRSVRTIETTAIDDGKLVLIDSTKFKVKTYKSIRIEFGWVNDDFQKNLVTVVCEMRLHSYHNSIDDSAILYDDIATITAALERVDA